jgi:hypothetical protein
VTVLEKSARTQLDRAVQAARRAATTGADRALRALAVDQEKKPAYFTPEQSELRRRLRVRCRGLGSWQEIVRASLMSSGTGCCLPGSWPRTGS